MSLGEIRRCPRALFKMYSGYANMISSFGQVTPKYLNIIDDPLEGIQPIGRERKRAVEKEQAYSTSQVCTGKLPVIATTGSSESDH